MASIPDITRMIARVQDWKERAGKAAPTPSALLGEAAKLFDEASTCLTELRRPLLGRGRQR
jgi:hypothetical protein